MKISISHVNENDRSQWEALYRSYAEFYKMPMHKITLDTVWSWILDPDNEFYGLLAKTPENTAIGLMHCREMPSPLRGAQVGFLDDLYVVPEMRGNGTVQILYKELASFAKQQGWPYVRWITAEDNYRGRGSYDKVAEKTHWVTYQLPIN